MSMFSDIAYEHIIDKINKEIEESIKEGKNEDYIEGLKRAKELVYKCY